MPTLISVIIPTFDRGNVLPEAIDSVLAQTHRDIDVIVVDDGSADGTRDLITSRYGGDARVRYRYQPNAGVDSARNAGLDLARGEYVAFLDSDDAWKPWHLSLLQAALDRHPEAGMAWTDMEAVDAHGSVLPSSYLTQSLSAYRYFTREDLFASSWPLSRQDCLFWLHTHTNQGLVHIEAPGPGTYTLGQFFAIWGKPLTTSQVGDTVVAGGRSRFVFLDGKPFAGDPGSISLVERTSRSRSGRNGWRRSPTRSRRVTERGCRRR